MSLQITLATKPRPASRPRYYNGRMLTSSSYRAYKKELALLLGCRSREIQRVLDCSKSLRVNYTFIFKRPKTGPNSKLPDGAEHTQRPDTDNLIKAVQDAMFNFAHLSDDSIVSSGENRKIWGSENKIIIEMVSTSSRTNEEIEELINKKLKVKTKSGQTRKTIVKHSRARNAQQRAYLEMQAKQQARH